MGSGKTTIGSKLARRIGRRFVDADDELEARSGRSVADWFESRGEAGFRRAEADLVGDLLGGSEPLVIGSGGGVVVLDANRRLLRTPGVMVVYLHGSPRFLASRTPVRPHRPLLADADPNVLFDEMYQERDRWYREVADIVVEIGPDPDRTFPIVDLVVEELRRTGITGIEGEPT